MQEEPELVFTLGDCDVIQVGGLAAGLELSGEGLRGLRGGGGHWGAGRW